MRAANSVHELVSPDGGRLAVPYREIAPTNRRATRRRRSDSIPAGARIDNRCHENINGEMHKGFDVGGLT